MHIHLRSIPSSLSKMLGVGVRTEFYELKDSLAGSPERASAVHLHLVSHPFTGVVPTVDERLPRPDYADWRAARAALPDWEPVRDELLRIIGPVPTAGIVNSRPSDPLERAARKVCGMDLDGLADVDAILAHLRAVPPIEH
jgi:hypothetical protein